MEEKKRISEIKITVCGNDVEVASDSIDYHGLKMATLGILVFTKENIELAKSKIEAAINEELNEEELKSVFTELLHEWVDKALKEDYELRQDN